MTNSIERRIEALEIARNRAWKDRRNLWESPDEEAYWAANRRLQRLSAKLQHAYNVRAEATRLYQDVIAMEAY